MGAKEQHEAGAVEDIVEVVMATNYKTYNNQI